MVSLSVCNSMYVCNLKIHKIETLFETNYHVDKARVSFLEAERRKQNRRKASLF